MAVIQQKDGTIILNGIEQGIADSPYTGIADMRNVNIISIPSEGSVNYGTQQSSPEINTSTFTISSVDTANDTITCTPNLTGLRAYTFTGGSLPSGIVAGTPYWYGNDNKLYTEPTLQNVLNITSSGLGTASQINIGLPKGNTKISTPFLKANFIIDANGRVWSDLGYRVEYIYMGNIVDNMSHGNGIVGYGYDNSTAKSYLFIFRDAQIDYATITSNTQITWTYGWNPADATTGNSNYLKCYNSMTFGFNSSHDAMIATDNRVYYCDSNWIGRWYQTDSSVTFNPATKSTYTFDQTMLLPNNDTANCLTQLGTNILVGGGKNVIYPWDRFSNQYQFPILVAEFGIAKLVTVNTNTFIFAGNRGRIYLTNGSQANLFKKIPDHLTDVVEPYFIWGGATSFKNQLYFSFNITTNNGVTLAKCGGVWAIDLESKALRMSNKLSYDSYAGYASVLTTSVSNNSEGTGIVAGWTDNGVYPATTQYGIDTPSQYLYGSEKAYIDFDMMEIGTAIEPRTIGSVEFKLAVPLLSSEKIKLQYRQKLSDSFVDIDSTVVFDASLSATAIYSGIYQSVPFENSQWLQLRAVMSCVGGNYSGVRLKEIRINRN